MGQDPEEYREEKKKKKKGRGREEDTGHKQMRKDNSRKREKEVK
jgi:hypothetical protein